MTQMDGDGQVRITLKDVYQQTQSLEKSLGDALGALNLTMQSIKDHIGRLDSRNAAADQIHVEHAGRLTKIENVVLSAQPEATHKDFEVRIRSLERFKYTLFGAVIVVNAAAAFIEYLLIHKG